MNDEINKSNSTGIVFTRFFDEIITKEGEFKDEYRSTDDITGFRNFIKLAKSVQLKPGEVVKFFDKLFDYRIIAVGTRFGSIILYDKYAHQGRFATIAAHFRKDIPTLRNVINGINIGEQELFKILGNSYDISNNIGNKLEEMSKDFTTSN